MKRSLASCAIGCCVLNAALAQESGLGSGEARIEEVVVTGRYNLLNPDTIGATRLPIALQDVPQSLTLISEDFIELADMRDLGSIGDYTAGVISNGPIFSTQTLKFRGFLDSPQETYKINGRKMYRLTDIDLSAFERIEVVKGPSSVIYGLGTPGGTLNMTFRNPPRTAGGALGLSYGSWDSMRLQAHYGGPVSDSTRLLGGVAYDKGNSHVNLVEHSRLTAYGAIDSHLTDRLRLEIDAATQQDRNVPSDGVPLLPDGTTPDLPRELFLGHPTENTIRADSNLLVGTLTFAATESVDVGVAGTLQQIDSRSVAFFPFGPSEANGDTTIAAFGQQPRHETWNLEAFATARFELFGQSDNLFNLSLFKSDIDSKGPFFPLRTTEFGDGTRFLNVNPFTQSQQQILTAIATGTLDMGRAIPRIENVFEHEGVSAQLVLQPFDPLSVNLGATYIEARQGDPLRGGIISIDDTAMRVGAVYEIVRDVNLYASYSESIIPQTYLDVNDNPLPALTGDQLEVGVKAMFFDKKLLLTGAAFTITEQNVAQVVPFTVPERYQAVGEVEHEGFELEAIGSPLPGLTLNANFTYLDARNTADVDESIVGQSRTFIPKKTASIFGSYELLEGRLRGVGFGAGVRHVGEQKISYEPGIAILPSYTVTELVAYYSSGDYDLRLNIHNALDEDYWLSMYDNIYYGFWHEAGRNVTFSIGRKF